MSVLKLFFNWVDLVLLVVAVRFIYKGYVNGLQKELFDCFRMGLVLFLTLAYFLYVSKLVQKYSIIPPVYAKIVAYLALSAAIFFVAGLIGRLLGSIGSTQFSGWFDKTATFFIALLHFGFTVGFVLFFTMLVPTTFSHEQVYEKSFVGKRMVRLILKNYTRIVKVVPVSPSRPGMQDFQKTRASAGPGE